MREEPQTSCKENKLVHAWKDITSNEVLASYPPQYPPRQEQCQNCGLVRTYREKIESWLDYKIGALPPKVEAITIDLTGNITTESGSGTTLLSTPQE